MRVRRVDRKLGSGPALFAWADAHVHEETYEDAEYDQYEAECVRYDNAFTLDFYFRKWPNTSRISPPPYNEEHRSSNW